MSLALPIVPRAVNDADARQPPLCQFATENYLPSPKRIPVFDGHNDALLRLNRRAGGDAVSAFLQGEDKGQLDLPKAREGGFAGGLFAIFVPSTEKKPATNQTPAPEFHRYARTSRRRPGRGAAHRACHGGAALPHRTAGEGAPARLPHCRRYRRLSGQKCARRRAAYRGRGSHRFELRDARRVARRRAALARAGVEQAQCIRPRCAVSLSVVARHWPGSDRSRQGADRRLQPPENSDRPVASQRTRVLGRCRAVRCAARRDALQRARHQSAFAQFDRQTACRHPQIRWPGRRQLRSELPSSRWRARQEHAARPDRAARRASHRTPGRRRRRLRLRFRRRTGAGGAW